MAKLDLYREHKQEYITPKKPALIKVGPAKYLTITGCGEPGGKAFQACVGALYSIAFMLKMEKKFAGQDYRVCHLEGLWWGDSIDQPLPEAAPGTWNWKLLIRVPGFITKKDLDKTISKLKAKGKPEDLASVKLERINEGLSVQMLHVGPYGEEKKTIAEMMSLAQSKGLSFRGPHHEIYLSDPRRVAPERLRTILRLPVQ